MLDDAAAPNRGDVSDVNESPAASSNSDEHILVLEAQDEVAASILAALHEAAPAAAIDIARNLVDAQRLLGAGPPDLLVLDIEDPRVARELLLAFRKTHPQARAIMLTGAKVLAHRQYGDGIGAISFLQKPIVHADLVELAQALLGEQANGKRREPGNTLNDLQVVDVVQLECISGATAALEVTARTGKRGRLYLEQGQVRHARAFGKEGFEAFRQIATWKIGNFSELPERTPPKTTIDIDWQSLLLQLVAEKGEKPADKSSTERPERKRILVIDDSPMLLAFVQEVLHDSDYDLTLAGSAYEGLDLSYENPPDLILLDYLLPDLRGDEVSRRLAANDSTARVPVLYMSGFGGDLENARAALPNVVGVVNKPFTPEMLLEQLREHLPQMSAEESDEPAEAPESAEAEEAAVSSQFTQVTGPEPAFTEPPPWNETVEAPHSDAGAAEMESGVYPQQVAAPPDSEQTATDVPFFSGNTNFFSLTWALRTIANEKLTGVLHCFANAHRVELYARNGQILLASTRDAQLYCAEAPTSLANVDAEQLEQARITQNESGCPLFITLLRRELVAREPALQLVRHHSQKLFAHLWSTSLVRFAFEQIEALPDFTNEVAPEDDNDHWILETLRFIQYGGMADKLNYDPEWIPAYTRDGFERVQKLRLNVAEAQFASQFNGTRSLAQIARNLRLDLKTARLTLFRFLALQIVECWPPPVAEKSERGGMFRRLVRRSTD